MKKKSRLSGMPRHEKRGSQDDSRKTSSSSASSIDVSREESKPVLGRASSVRVSMPKIVQHKPTVKLVDPEIQTNQSTQRLEVLPTVEEAQATIERSGSIGSQYSTETEKAEQVNPPNTGNTLHSVEASINQAPSLNRTMSSPLPGISRRVTIRPADLVIRNHPNSKSFRESIVTTPYPPRTSFDNDSTEEKEEPKKVVFKDARDRFPSPERPEVLFLELCIGNHPSARRTIEIQIGDRTSFDDEILFRKIRTAYQTQLLGSTRQSFLLLRQISRISGECDSADFVRHFENPSIGHRRKTWINWLRSNNTKRPSVRRIDDLNRLSSVRQSPRHSSWAEKRMSTASDASSFNFVYSPAMPRLPFLGRHENAKLASPNPAHVDPDSPSWQVDESEVKVASIMLHHQYRLGMIALLTLLVVLQAGLAAALWIVFGVPGTRPGMDGKVVGKATFDETDVTSWKGNAPGRVLTGVVIGIVCLLVGALAEAVVVWGSARLL